VKRGAGLKTRKPLAQFSAKKLDALKAAGIDHPMSTFTSVLPAELVRQPRTPMKAKSRKPALPAKQKKTLAERSGGFCEIQMTGCANIAVDPSHRITTKSGGRHGDAADEHARLSNVMAACRSCHDWIGDHPAAAKSEGVGWALEEWQDPARCAALYRGELSWLLDDGRVVGYEELAA
jgi:hypothetical protein